MLEWTGERFLPWAGGSTIAYEHLHRYAYASTLVEGKRVLDLASGEGYGSKMLAAKAASVVGVDVDNNAVQHAAGKYSASNLQFLCGSITAVPIPDAHSFDVIICFEAIEHIENHDALLAEVKRLLAPAGIFVVSTPNKAVYHDESPEENPFHVKELYFEEFRELLGRNFRHSQFFGQRIHPGSSIWPIQAEPVAPFQEFVVDRGKTEFEFIASDNRLALYFIGTASDSVESLPSSGSVLLDQSDGLLEEKNEEIRKSLEEARWRADQLADRDRAITSLEEALKWRERQVDEHNEHLKKMSEAVEWSQSRAAEMEKTIASNQEALAWRAEQVSDLQAGKDYLERESTAMRSQLQKVQQQLAVASDTLAGIYASRSWKLMMKLRSIRDRFKGLAKSRD